MVRKIKQSPKLPADERRHQLLDAAQHLFSERGYRETSTEDIALKAGVTKGALYFHFESKEDILFALIERITDSYRQMMERAASRLREPGDLLLFFLQDCTFAHEREFRSVLDTWVQSMHVPRIKRYINNLHREGVAKFCDLVGPRPGWTRQELEQLAMMIHFLANGIAAHRVLNNRGVNVKTQARLFQSMFESRRPRANAAESKNRKKVRKAS